jgi:hypothetical protein
MRGARCPVGLWESGKCQMPSLVHAGGNVPVISRHPASSPVVAGNACLTVHRRVKPDMFHTPIPVTTVAMMLRYTRQLQSMGARVGRLLGRAGRSIRAEGRGEIELKVTPEECAAPGREDRGGAHRMLSAGRACRWDGHRHSTTSDVRVWTLGCLAWPVLCSA